MTRTKNILDRLEYLMDENTQKDQKRTSKVRTKFKVAGSIAGVAAGIELLRQAHNIATSDRFIPSF